MKAILQLSTGVYQQCTDLSTAEIRNRLDRLLGRIPARGVIYGWGRREGLNETIVETAHMHGAEAFLWMPVFADVREPERADPMIFWGKETETAVNTCPGEEFQFVCPGSVRNQETVWEDYELLTSECRPDGVFLDRIRYPSAVFSKIHFLGCRCEKCQKAFSEMGVDPLRVERHMDAEADPEWFRPEEMENGRYHYRDQDLEQLNERKRRVIEQAVTRYAETFHAKGLKIGIDVFAPALSDLVGQDLHSLLNLVDFVKPMMYFRTKAPAGIPCELEAYGTGISCRLSSLWGTDIGDIASMEKQLFSLPNTEEKVYPGIEVNRIPGICEPEESGFLQAVRSARHAGCDTMVLSWNVLQAREEDLEKAAAALREN